MKLFSIINDILAEGLNLPKRGYMDTESVINKIKEEMPEIVIDDSFGDWYIIKRIETYNNGIKTEHGYRIELNAQNTKTYDLIEYEIQYNGSIIDGDNFWTYSEGLTPEQIIEELKIKISPTGKPVEWTH